MSPYTFPCRFGARVFFVGICSNATAAVLKRWLGKHKFYSQAAASPEQLFLGALVTCDV
jgi:hypothetical protein